MRILPEYTLPFIPCLVRKSQRKERRPRLRLIEDVLVKVISKMGSADSFQYPLAAIERHPT